MSQRYTSPELSRRLRDAGLEQDSDPSTRYRRPAQQGHEAQLMEPQAGSFRPDGTNGRGLPWFRALRLDEVLEELTREREGGALCEDKDRSPLLTTCREGSRNKWLCSGDKEEDSAMAQSPVEAAGLLLTQLLEARR